MQIHRRAYESAPSYVIITAAAVVRTRAIPSWVTLKVAVTAAHDACYQVLQNMLQESCHAGSVREEITCNQKVILRLYSDSGFQAGVAPIVYISLK